MHKKPADIHRQRMEALRECINRCLGNLVNDECDESVFLGDMERLSRSYGALLRAEARFDHDAAVIGTRGEETC